MCPKDLHHPWLSVRHIAYKEEHENATDKRRGDKRHYRDDSPKDEPLSFGASVELLFWHNGPQAIPGALMLSSSPNRRCFTNHTIRSAEHRHDRRV